MDQALENIVAPPSPPLESTLALSMKGKGVKLSPLDTVRKEVRRFPYIANIKTMVSKKKHRFVMDGFNLDLTYITDQIIAMGFPSQNLESVYRNDMPQVRSFLEKRHKDKYCVYNLCSERSYDAAEFDGRVVCFPFEDHNCPKFGDLLPLCENIHNWLEVLPDNVAAIHCKAGKGRTGLVVCVYMLFAQIWTTAEEALAHYATMRTQDQNGVTIPSQRRYVSYFEKLMKYRLIGQAVADNGPIFFNEMHVSEGASDFEQVDILNDGVKYSSLEWGNSWKQQTDLGFLIKPLYTKIHGDFHVTFYGEKKMGKKKRLWSFWANTCFIKDDYLSLDKASLDKVCKSKYREKPNFSLEVYFNSQTKHRRSHA